MNQGQMQVRDTYVQWVDTGVKEPQVASGGVAAARKPVAVEVEKWRDGQKPSLIYWSWSDETDPRGKDSKRADKGVWDNEQVARATRLFDCYRVDAKDVPAATLAKYGVQGVPLVTIVNADRVPLASAAASSSGEMSGFLWAAAKRFFPEYWKGIAQRMTELAKRFDEGRAAMAKKDWETASAAFSEVYRDDVRTDLFDRARDLMQQVQMRRAKEAQKQ